MLPLRRVLHRSPLRSLPAAQRASLSATTKPLRASLTPAGARHLSSTPLSSSLLRSRPITNRSMVVTSSSVASVPGSSRQLATPASAALTLGTGPFEGLPTGFEIRDTLNGSKAAAQYAIFTKDLEISAQDDMRYRLVRLANGLEALVIQDPKTDKSSAAMDIRVGHLSDPEELQGLAHFCEHLLFMGTKKYPRENEYSEYLSNHSGGSNAYTGMDNTNYFFDVSPDHFEGALDRFAQFFLEPLFDPSCSEREIKAVDSEHKKNLQSDMWRGFQLDKTLSDPSHPYSHFGTGNYQTLWEDPKSKGMDVRDELLKFHDQYYSANVMKLVVLGKEDLDQLTSWVVDKFSGVRNTGREPPLFDRSPLTQQQLQKQIFAKSVRDVRKLKIAFPIPDQGPHFRSKPGHFLSHFIGHEGKGSILSHLKKKGWCDRLSAGASGDANGFEFFKISIDLTQEGLQNHEKVVESIFKYIHLLRTSNLEQWTHDEVAQLSELMFRFKEKIDPADYASSTATQMQMPYPREWILSGAWLTRDFDRDLIKQTLDHLTPQNCRVVLMAKTLPDGTTTWESKEKWYGTEYSIKPLPSQLLTQTPTEFEDLHLPRPNSFIPANFEFKGPIADAQGKKPTPRPQLVLDNDSMRVWHKLDDRFGLPKANVFFVLRNPLINATPSTSIKTRMLIELISDSLVEYSYDATLAGLSYMLDSQDQSLALSLSGYNDKIPVLARSILDKLANFQVDPRRFELVKDRVKRSYQNFAIEEPYRHATYYTTYLLQERMWTPQEKLRELEQLDVAEVQQFLPDLLQRMHLEVLAHGNLAKEEAIELSNMAWNALKSCPVNKTELLSSRSMLLPEKCNHIWKLPVTNAANVNSAIEYYVQVGEPTDLSLRAPLSLFSQIANEPVFDQLRTKEQLGYLVFSGIRRGVGSLGWRVIVQSERDAPYLEGRVDAFLDQFKATLEKMTEQEFEGHKRSIIHKKLENVKNLVEESQRFWSPVFGGTYDFFARYADVEAIATTTKEQVMDLFMKYIHPSSATRSKLSMHLNSTASPSLRFSAKAVDALEQAVNAQGLAVPKEAFDALRAQQPAIEAVKDMASQAMAQSPVPLPAEAVKQMLELVDGLAVQFPFTDASAASAAAAPAADAAAVKVESAIKPQDVTDATAFKAQLNPSKAAVPARSFDELAKDPSAEADELATIAEQVLRKTGAAPIEHGEPKANL
ncbi:related to STE23-Metalloprotease involved in a-factor processing [Sporisorium reilianum f. sp. reilianum]|uniref:Related to STE23-Metalloprotease involved in a-factor processing n=1 Tax=Sporisorium reilianum f. sp. reilianum TaxID=72559 RepID=A0A2N8UFF1_9BASI|nr:related to STE23-Metalloprotease involved in a-factor processing [Sporisorium reilianum f. sp. reilianum]